VPGIENYSKNALKVIGSAKVTAGDRVRVVKQREVYEGTLLPRAELGDRNSLVIKLDNGYNIGINAGGAKMQRLKGDMKTLEGEFGLKKWREQAKAKLKHDPNKPTIAILHTGGTVASRVDYRTGGVTTSFTPEDIIHMFPELAEIANIRSRLIRNMWSQDMRFEHYNLLAKEIEKETKAGVDGIIVTHGTDTMHYTGAALSFALEGLRTPVLLVASQRSSDRPSSDAGANLICAARFIAGSDWAGVGLCMHEGSSDDTCLILPGTKVRKMHASRRDTFRPINTTAIARVKYPSGDVEMITDAYEKRGKERPRLRLFKPKTRVAILRQHTNMWAEQFSAYKGWDGLVIEVTGLGHLPTSEIDAWTREHRKIFGELQKLIKGGTVVVLAPTLYGRLNLDVYANQREMLQAGVLGHLSDMTPETSFIKLAWLLSNYPKKRAKELISENLRGELTAISEVDTFLI
jgi:glutamyl-tRNA(Gln) amidotransferase subunit D